MSSQSPEKKATFRSRMGTVMRRTSSVVTLGNAGHHDNKEHKDKEHKEHKEHAPTKLSSMFRRPSVASSSETSSVGGGGGSSRPSIEIAVPTSSPAPSSQAQHHDLNQGSVAPASVIPSPIAESPAREQAASEQDLADAAAAKQRTGTGAVGVASPLSKVIAPEPEIVPMDFGAPTEEKRQPEPEHQPQNEDAPKFFDHPHTAGPGVFVDEPDAMSIRSHEHLGHHEHQGQEHEEEHAPHAPPPELGFSDAITDTHPPLPNPHPPTLLAPPMPDSPELKTSVEEPSYFTVSAPAPIIVSAFQPSGSRAGSLHEAILQNTMGDNAVSDTGTEAALSSQTTPRPLGSTADAENSNVFYAYVPPSGPPPGLAIPQPEPKSKPKTPEANPIVIQIPNTHQQAQPPSSQPPSAQPHIQIREPVAQPVVIQIPHPEESQPTSAKAHVQVPMNPMPEPRMSGSVPPGFPQAEVKPGYQGQEPPKSSPIPIPVVFAHDPWAQERSSKPKDGPNGHAASADDSDDPFADRHQVPTYPQVTVVEYPLPAFHEVIPDRPLKEPPSMGTLRGGTDSGHNDPAEYSDHKPLLSVPPPPPPRRQVRGGYMSDSEVISAPGSALPHVVNLSSMDGDSIRSTDYYSRNQYQYRQDHQPPHDYASYMPQSRLAYLGFIEFPLPDGGVYYIHATRRVVVDGDLKREGRADELNRYLNAGFDSAVWDARTGCAEPGWELWLKERERQKKKKPVVKGGKKAKTKGKARMTGDEQETVEFARYWVDHKGRRVIVDPDTVPPKERGTVDDTLDAEYRYWSYMEDHPAHTSLPTNARKDAMDVLNWTWSDRLLRPSNASSPFTQDECKHLLDHLKSFGDMRNDPSNSGIQSFVHTRVVARVLMRSTQWRQATFRPHKPFPQDVPNTKRHVVHPTPPVPFRKRFLDFIVSIFFLGVPYIFMNRMHPARFLDEEGGMNVLRGAAAPMMVIGACTCLVAAIILSASVTFLSLPGLDAISRVVGLVSALLATFSMIATVIAVFKYKSDLERSFSPLAAFSGYGSSYGTIPSAGFGSGAGEGMMLHSRRIVILSLPLTLLIYSVIAFVSGIVLYSFFGKVTDVQPGTLARHFESYTQWSVVGVLGGLAGVLFTAMLMLRK
ncbi:hypothetical protein V5O48_013414 [Marasmius crinis-equi]|uniref:Uncharacterized protein n=1 Tax=Marasmius crinis-equi TaxID=585013 RepID=A0ABR3F0I8_9AGAR